MRGEEGEEGILPPMAEEQVRGEERRREGGEEGTLTSMAGEERRGEENEEKRGHSLQWQER